MIRKIILKSFKGDCTKRYYDNSIKIQFSLFICAAKRNTRTVTIRTSFKVDRSRKLRVTWNDIVDNFRQKITQTLRFEFSVAIALDDHNPSSRNLKQPRIGRIDHDFRPSSSKRISCNEQTPMLRSCWISKCRTHVRSTHLRFRLTCRSSSVRFIQASSDVNPNRRSRSPKLANSVPGPGIRGISPEEEAVGWKFLTSGTGERPYWT